MRKEQEHTVNIPTDYKVVIPDQVLEEEIKQLEQEEQKQQEEEPATEALEALKAEPNYEANLKMQLDIANNRVTELQHRLKTGKKNISR